MPYPSYSTTDGLVSLSSPDDRVLTDLSLHWPSLQRDEAKAKDRVISHLESELRIETGRAQQFRDLLEKNLATSLNRSVPSLLFFLLSTHFFPSDFALCFFFACLWTSFTQFGLTIRLFCQRFSSSSNVRPRDPLLTGFFLPSFFLPAGVVDVVTETNKQTNKKPTIHRRAFSRRFRHYAFYRVFFCCCNKKKQNKRRSPRTHLHLSADFVGK